MNERTPFGWNNWRKMSGVICDKRVPPHVKGNIHKTIVQPAMLYGIGILRICSHLLVGSGGIWGAHVPDNAYAHDILVVDMHP